MANVLDLSPRDFQNFITEERQYRTPEQIDNLIRRYNEANSLSGRLSGLLAPQEGRRRTSILPASVPEGMSLFDALKAGEAKLAVPQGIVDMVTGTVRGVENPALAAQGRIPASDMNAAGFESAAAAMGLASLFGRAPVDAVGANMLRSGKMTDPTETGWTFRDVKAPNLSREENRRVFEALSVPRGYEVELPIRRLFATQDKVNPDFATTTSSEGMIPTVIRKDGEFFIRDGHHRLTKQAEAGNQNAKVWLYDLDNQNRDTPLLDYEAPRQLSRKEMDKVESYLAELGLLDETLSANASKSAGLLSVASDVADRGDQILNMLKSGKGSEVTDAMLDMGDSVKNTQLNQYLAANYDLPMDEASRLARAREMGLLDTAYHSTGRDFQNFVPSEFRGASFFAATPEGASKGASASANEGVGSGSKITMPVRVDTSGVEGLGAYARKDMNEFRASLPDRIYTEAEVDALMASDSAPLRGNWNDFFDDLTDYDALRKFRDENPTKEIPDGIVKFRPKRPKSYNKDLKTDLSGRQFAHYSEGMSERPTSEYVKSQGNTGFTMMDESGLALAMVDPTKVRSQFARFDPRLSHLSNVTAANASKGTGAMTLWHGSPYDFNEFDLSKIGTGEGAQDLGRGFSLTDYEANAHLYTNPASRWGDLAAMERYRQAGPGRYYQVNVGAAPEQFLDWNKPWRDQVPEGTPLYDALAKEEAVMLSQYADDPAMQAAIPRGKVSSMWRDNLGLEDAALQSGFVGNSRRNYSGDTEYTVFDPSLLRIDQKFDADGNVVSANTSPISGLLAQSGVSSEQAQRIEDYLYKTGLLQ